MPRDLDLSSTALIAGRGTLPSLLIQALKAQGHPFVVIAFKDQTDPCLVADIPHLWISFGEVGKALAYLKENKVTHLVMAGGVTRPSLRDLKPDWKGVKWLAHLGTKTLGDDGLLKNLIELIEAEGYSLVAPDALLEHLLAPKGILTTSSPDEDAWRDIRRGLDVLWALSPVDVGQGVVTQEGLVLGIEAIEGTDALIQRTSTLHRQGPGGILVKISKRTQDLRVDLPTIGPHTVRHAKAAGLRGIAIEAERTLLLEKEETVALANACGLFIVGLDQDQCHRHL